MTRLGELCAEHKLADKLIALVVALRPFFAQVAKAKTAKMVRTLIDQLAKIPDTRELQMQLVATTVPAFLVRANPAMQLAVGIPVAVLSVTFVWSVIKVVRQKLSPRTRRKRLVARNLGVIERLNKYLPTRRGELTAQIVRAVRSQSGFSAEEVFRKYLRYVLDQRPFDADAVADIMALRDAAGLTPETTARALEDLSRRMYQSHGALMLKTDGMGASGTQRKVTGRNYFRKLLYLVELEELIPRAGGGSGADGEASLFGREQLRDMFGATDVDVDEVRMSAEEVAAAARGE